MLGAMLDALNLQTCSFFTAKTFITLFAGLIITLTVASQLGAPLAKLAHVAEQPLHYLPGFNVMPEVPVFVIALLTWATAVFALTVTAPVFGVIRVLLGLTVGASFGFMAAAVLQHFGVESALIRMTHIAAWFFTILVATMLATRRNACIAWQIIALAMIAAVVIEEYVWHWWKGTDDKSTTTAARVLSLGYAASLTGTVTKIMATSCEKGRICNNPDYIGIVMAPQIGIAQFILRHLADARYYGD